MIGLAAAMGLSPRDFGAMSVFEFNAAVTGYMRAHVPDDAKGMSSAEEDALWEFIQERPHVH